LEKEALQSNCLPLGTRNSSEEGIPSGDRFPFGETKFTGGEKPRRVKSFATGTVE